VVECTRDQLANLIGRDIAAAARAASAASPTAVDLFAGSGNTLHWIKTHTGACHAIGFELDDTVFNLAHRNLSIMDLGIDLRHDSYLCGLPMLNNVSEDDLLIVFVAPPWGRALSERGLDLRRTAPPVSEVINTTIDILGSHKLLFAVQVYETVEPDSLTEVTTQCPWWEMKVYDINAAGQNHGLLLASWGWSAA